MKRGYKTSAAMKRPAAKKLEPMPPWNGRPTTVKLNDWAAFMTVNHLRAVRSWIVGEEDGILKIEVIVEDEARANASPLAPETLPGAEQVMV